MEKFDLFSGVRIGVKLPVVIVVLVALSIGIMSAIGAQSTRNLIKAGALEKLRGLAILKAEGVESLFQVVERDLVFQASAPFTVTALQEFTRAFAALEDAESELRRAYITDNAHPLGEKDLLVTANTGTDYDAHHEAYHPHFDTLQNDMDYYDVFLFDVAGNLVYSVFKENDYATNMLSGPWSTSGLAEVFRRASELGPGDRPVFIDFAPYEPSYFAPAAFIGRPVFDTDGTTQIGVLAYQMPVDQLNQAARDLDGLGQTANGFLVGDDGLMRTDSVLTEANDVLAVTIASPSLANGLAGEIGTSEGKGVLGQEVLEAFAPVSVGAESWVVFVQQDQGEIFQGIRASLIQSLTYAGLIFAVVFAASVAFSRSIARPVQRLTSAVGAVSKGVLDTEVTETDRQDEIGELARAAEGFRKNAIEMERLNEEQVEAARKMQEMAEEREQMAERERQAAADKVAAEAQAAEAREAMMRELGDAFGRVVESAVAGEFSTRVSARFDDTALIKLAENMNRLMGTVEHGLKETGNALERVAGGDFSQTMDGQFQGAFAALQSHVNYMIAELCQLIGGISNSGGTLAGSSRELKETADVLSRQAEQNATSVEESSAALEELTSSIKQVDENIQSVGNDARDARSIAETSEKIAAEASESMNRIADGSKEIARVIEVIDDIAFQINLLALNAGVEAARAGEAGLGFAVVASEVRQLSHRASDAASEIAEVIRQSDEAVETGVRHVSSAKESLEDIANSVVRISDSIDEVTTAIAEQSSGVAEIATSVTQIDSNIQKQAAAFEEVTASSQLLSGEAEDLNKATGRFRLAEDSETASLAATG